MPIRAAHLDFLHPRQISVKLHSSGILYTFANRNSVLLASRLSVNRKKKQFAQLNEVPAAITEERITMATPIPDSKYALQDLHQEIDFFDRKISYCKTYEKFDTENARAAALQKLEKKRDTLVKAALGMASRGIECDVKYLPRSFKAKAAGSEVAE